MKGLKGPMRCEVELRFRRLRNKFECNSVGKDQISQIRRTRVYRLLTSISKVAGRNVGKAKSICGENEPIAKYNAGMQFPKPSYCILGHFIARGGNSIKIDIGKSFDNSITID